MIILTDGSKQEFEAEVFSKARCFWKRTDIKHIDIPSGVKTIRKESFYECVNLESITIPYGVTVIEPLAFFRCRKLRHVTLPESLKVVGPKAFAESGLEDMTLISHIKQMGDDAFIDCPNLKRFVVPEGYKANTFGIYRDKVTEMIVPPELEHLCKDALRDEWYYPLKNKNLNELESLIEDVILPNPIMITISSIWDDFESSDIPIGMHHFISPAFAGPFFNAKDAYAGLCDLLRHQIDSIVPNDINLLAANLVAEYNENGVPNQFDTFDLNDSIWKYAICFHPLPRLLPGKPVYAVVAQLWHSASFHPTDLLFGFARTKTLAKQLFPTPSSYQSYPYSQDKPEILVVKNS